VRPSSRCGGARDRQAGEILDQALSLGVLEKSGAHLSFGGEHLGTAASAAREALLARSDLADSLRRAALVARGQEPLNGAAHG
jgi:recombination protein RecA